MSNEEKILQILETQGALLETLVVKVDRLEQGQAKLEQGQAKLEQKVDTLEERLQVVRDSQLNVELKELPRIAAALDGYKLNRETTEQHNERITCLEKEVGGQDIRLFTLEQAAKKA